MADVSLSPVYSSSPRPRPASARRTPRRSPNHALRNARLRLPSAMSPGEPLTQRELADAVNAWLYDTTGQVFDMDQNHIRRYETGQYRWPRAHYRQALRVLLGAPNDHALGFYPRYPGSGSTTQP